MTLPPADKVLHAFFEGPSIRLYASDGPDSEPMKGCALFVENDDPVAAPGFLDIAALRAAAKKLR